MLDYKPNISSTGADNRRRRGWRQAAVWGVGVVVSAAFALPWWIRGLLAAPAALSAINFFQARRMTCVLRAGEGMFEGDDLSTTPAPAEDVAASRRVSRGIWRDSLLIGAAGGALAAASALVR